MPQHLFVLGDPHEQHQSAQSGENPARVRNFSHGHVQTLPSSFVVQQGASYSSAQAMQRAKMMHNPEYVEALWQATYEPPPQEVQNGNLYFQGQSSRDAIFSAYGNALQCADAVVTGE